MTRAQKERFARIVRALSDLRGECDAADKSELSVLILECIPTLARPCDPPVVGAAPCPEHDCAEWQCAAAHSAKDPYDCIR